MLTWLEFKNEVKSLLADSATDLTGIRAVADYVRAMAARDLFKDFDGFKASYGAYQKARGELLGYSLAIPAADLQASVRELLGDSSVNDTTFIRVVADYVKAALMRDSKGDAQAFALYGASYAEGKRRLFGYQASISGAALRVEVNKLITDATVNDDSAVRAVADFVKAKVAREVNHDIELHNSYYANWLEQRLRLAGYAITMNDTALRAAVNPLITTDANRLGASDFIDKQIYQARLDLASLNAFIGASITQAVNDISGMNAFLVRTVAQAVDDLARPAVQIDKKIRQAVIDLQSYIELYRQGHETFYGYGDIYIEGNACVGSLPEEAQLRDIWRVNVDDCCIRQPVTLCNWKERQNLTCGQPVLNTAPGGLVALSPNSLDFYLYPALTENVDRLLLSWDGVKLEFEDDDNTPFDELMAGVVAEFVRGGDSADYQKKRRLLYLNAIDRQRIK